eukprot:bmy_17507T0
MELGFITDLKKVVSMERFHALISKMDLTFDRKLKALRDEEGKSQGKIAARVGSTAMVSVHYRAKFNSFS